MLQSMYWLWAKIWENQLLCSVEERIDLRKESRIKAKDNPVIMEDTQVPAD